MPRLLDLFCCEGGASTGYARAGFDVYGVDLFRHVDTQGKLVGHHRDRYPFPAHQGDALQVLRDLLDGRHVAFEHHGTLTALALGDFDAIAASPPCKGYTRLRHAVGGGHHHARLIPATRELLVETRLPYVIENVDDARQELVEPLTLCGSEFGLRGFDDTTGRLIALRRHRLFEANFPLWGAGGCTCAGDRAAGRIVGVYGHGGTSPGARGIGATKAQAELLLGIDWMSRDGLSQCIPPAYTEFLGEQLLAQSVDAAFV